MSLALPLWISLCPLAQCDLPGHRTLQDVPSHGHLETRLRLPGQYQVRALRSPRYPLKSSRNSAFLVTFCYRWKGSFKVCDGLASAKRPTAALSPVWPIRVVSFSLISQKLKSNFLDCTLYSSQSYWAICSISPPPFLIFWNLIKST